jgi:hypothetical protein
MEETYTLVSAGSGITADDFGLQQDETPPQGRFRSTDGPSEDVEDSGGFSPSTVKEANREFTRLTLLAEKPRLLEEHRQLVAKEFSTDLTRIDQQRLRWIRWQLDRIEDAEFGQQIDRFRALIKSHRDLGDDIRKLIAKLNTARR